MLLHLVLYVGHKFLMVRYLLIIVDKTTRKHLKYRIWVVVLSHTSDPHRFRGSFMFIWVHTFHVSIIDLVLSPDFGLGMRAMVAWFVVKRHLLGELSQALWRCVDLEIGMQFDSDICVNLLILNIGLHIWLILWRLLLTFTLVRWVRRRHNWALVHIVGGSSFSLFFKWVRILGHLTRPTVDLCDVHRLAVTAVI
jgi:hypothetical protein